MLKRIKSIQHVGKFRSCKAASLEFGNLNFIYGLNTYGKSTLGDIFSSLRSGDATILKARKTIPLDNTPQEIELSFQQEGAPEVSVKYSGSSWGDTFPANLRLNVFDDGFYHKNLFSSRQFTRATKEAFSAFVLGEQGVLSAKNIAEKNKRKGDLTRQLTKLKKDVFGDVSDMTSFLKNIPEDSQLHLEEKINWLRAEYERVKKQRGSVEKIIGRKIFSSIFWEKKFSEGFGVINSALSSSIKSHHESARREVAEHINKNFSYDRGAESWIRQGLSFRKGADCSFCGQYLTLEAMDLIALYEQSFDASFENHSKDVVSKINQAKAAFTLNLLMQLRLVVGANKEALVSYPELDANEYFAKVKEEILKLEEAILVVLDEWEASYKEFSIILDQTVVLKKESPNTALPELNDFGLLSADRKLAELSQRYNDLAALANEVLAEFKQKINTVELSKEMEEITASGLEIARRISRHKLSAQCQEYEELLAEIEALALEIPALNEALRVEQSEFLDEYFIRVDEYFKRFGSEDFSLSKGEDNGGHTPIFYLKVKFRGHDVSEKNLEQVFSESDRRALALSVFWAGIVGLEEVERNKLIVILDDPVTSFDCNRMSAAHHEIFELSKVVRQVIVLSHFEHGISSFLSVYRNQLPVKLISLVRVKDSSGLAASDIELFIATEHEKRRAKILSFIACETETHSATDLRVFLENELSSRFAQQIVQAGISEPNLSDRIDRLKETGVISESTAQEAHGLRLQLNPNHHIWVGNNIEDQRGVATKLMGFVYERLVPVS